MLKKLIMIGLMLVSLFGLVSCGQKESPNTIVVGGMAGPESQLLRVAKKVAKDRYGLNVKIVTFTDYNVPNEALNAGNLDANEFQHIPFLNAQMKAHGYRLVPIAKTFIFPMGLYSRKIKNVNQLKSGDTIAIPNDPSNEARALLLLQKAKLIRLRRNAGFNATPIDIVRNPKKLKFIELDAAELPRALNDVSLAAINTTYSVPAGLSPSKNAIYVESVRSPYANVIVVRANDKKNPKLLQFVKAYQSQPVINAAKKIFGDAAIPAWKKK